MLSLAVRETVLGRPESVWRVGDGPTVLKSICGMIPSRWDLTSEGQYPSFEWRYDKGAYLMTKSGKPPARLAGAASTATRAIRQTRIGEMRMATMAN